MNFRRTVLLTIEHKEREFLPKCFLALHLVRKGFRVYLGSSEAIHQLALRSKPSVFFHKSTHPKSPVYKRLGHTFVFLDEEGGVTTPTSTIEEFCDWRYATVAQDRQDLIFLPGEKWRTAVSRMKNTEGVRLVTSGWPRVDLWTSRYADMHREMVSNIQMKHGKFFLFPTSFGAGGLEGFREVIDSSPNEMFREIQQHKMEAFIDYVGLIRDMSPLLGPDERIVIRPHPSEKISEWRNTLGNLANVDIVREGDITPWILASHGLIQFGSTTVTQASLNGKTNVQFKVRGKTGVTDSPSFDLAISASSASEVYEILSSAPMEDLELVGRAKAILKEEMAFDDDKMAVEVIADVLNDLELSKHSKTEVRTSLKLMLWAVFALSKFRFKLQRLGLSKSSFKTVYENIPGGLSRMEVMKTLGTLNQVENFPIEYRVNSIGENLVCIDLEDGE